MDQSGQYPPMHPRHQLFQSQQLPPPSQLHLPSFSRSNTLPPIPNIPPSTQPHPFPPVSTYQTQHSHPHPQSSALPPLPPSPTSPHHWPTLHRTSNSREELYPPHQQSHPRSDSSRQPVIVKHESASTLRPFAHHHDAQHQPQHHPHPPKESSSVEDGMPSTSDFVKKLYKMLEDQSFQHVVSWGPQGDCFVVKDMNEFTKSILPRMFKHSNFASFVRQLNKYDFHKVKNTDDNQFGEHSWTFRHPDFHADRRDALENIKRKVPAQRKSLPNPTTSSTQNGAVSTSPGPFTTSSAAPASPVVEALQAQVDRLAQAQEDMSAHVRTLERNYQDVLAEMVNFQRNIAQQDGLMQNLIQYFLQVENGKGKAQNNASASGSVNTDSSDQNPFLPTQEAQRMMGSYPESDVARASLLQMNEISRRAEVAGMSFSNGEPSSSSNVAGVSSQGRHTPRILAAAAAGLMGWDAGANKGMSREDTLARIEELQRSRPTSAQGGFGVSGDEAFVLPEDSEVGETREGLQAWPGVGPGASGGPPSTHQGLQVYTLGHLMPRSAVDDANGNWSFDTNLLDGDPTGGSGTAAAAIGSSTDVVDSSTYDVPEQPAPDTPFNDAEETVNPSPPIAGQEPQNASQKLRIRRSTFVPGWAVPPRVLLVDDDAVSRKLSSKFLQVFGCTIDVAVDGVGAVNKMNLEKYDLVLMDIVMPKLDGVSATSLIRQFDHMTPIISMTSNSKPDEIMTYYSSGMNDILPKPFTKQGLLDMLEKHLMHLKVIQQQMSKMPRSVDMAPLSGGTLEDALTEQDPSAVATSSTSGTSGELLRLNGPGMIPVGGGGIVDDGRINPLAGLGLSDEQYAAILQNMVNGESFSGIARMGSMGVVGEGVGGVGVVGGGSEKRGLEDASDGRDVKRSRFELVE